MTIYSMERSTTEINLCRLLAKCELRGRDFASTNDWRLEKYVDAASAMLSSILKGNSKPNSDAIKEYTRRIDFLKKLIESKKDSPIDRVVAAQLMPHSVPSHSDNIIKEIQQKTAAKYVTDVRQELFKSEKGNDLRHRRNEMTSGEDLDALLKHNQDYQEKITAEMMILTRTLKEQSQHANYIINKDVETMSKSHGQMDSNNARLEIEAAILAEHNRRAWKCWLWVLLAFVVFVFINMVLFMKVMKKRVF